MTLDREHTEPARVCDYGLLPTDLRFLRAGRTLKLALMGYTPLGYRSTQIPSQHARFLWICGSGTRSDRRTVG
jgi:hypothetical protein